MVNVSQAAMAVILAIALPCLSWTQSWDQADAYYDHYTAMYEISGNKAKLEFRTRLVINNARGDKHRFVTFWEYPLRSLDKLHIRVLDSTGSVISEFEKSNLEKICGFGRSFVLYSDLCHYPFEAASPGYPYSIEYSFIQEWSSLFLFRGLRFPDDIPARNIDVQLIHPTNLPLRIRQYAVSVAMEETIGADRHVRRWRATDYSPPDEDSLGLYDLGRAGEISVVAGAFRFASLDFQGSTWQEIGLWCHRLVSDRMDHGGDAVVTALPDTAIHRIVDSTCNALARNFRYVSVDVGLSGWQPRRAETTRKTGYGDCKDLSVLLVSDLHQQGIAALPALLLTRSEGFIDPDFPNFGFNHMIVAVPRSLDTLWIDPTCSDCPLGELPYVDEDVCALLVTPEGGRLVRTPGSTSAENAVVKTATVRVQPDLNLLVTGTVRYGGNSGLSFGYKAASFTGDDLYRYVEEMLDIQRVRLEVTDAEIEYFEDRPAVGIRFQAHSKKPIKPVKGVVYLSQSPFASDQRIDTDGISDLCRPARLGYPRARYDSTVVIVDQHLSADSVTLPANSAREESFAGFQSDATGGPDSILVTLSKHYNVYLIEPVEFDTLAAYESELDEAVNRYVRIWLPSGR